MKPVSDGSIYSFTMLHRSFPGFETPFMVAWIDLADGRRILARIQRGDDQGVEVGQAVKLTDGSTEPGALATFGRMA